MQTAPDAFSRRRLFQLGGVSLLSGGLLRVLAAQAQAAGGRAGTIAPRARACILLFQVGGPYQGDTFDPKPDAPEEVRGIFRTISTSVPGIRMTEALARTSLHADKLTLLRGVHHTIRCHNPAIYCSLVGREATDAMAVSNRTNAQRTDHPHYASVVARLRPGAGSMPGHVIISNVTFNGPARSPGLLGGYLGPRYDPFVLNADPNAADYHVDAFAPAAEVTGDRLHARRDLLLDLEGRADAGTRSAMGTLYERAFSLLTSPRAREAFDLSREPAALRDRYGRHAPGQGALLARRLVEAGVPFVTVFSHTVVERNSWDTHNDHYSLVPRELAPPADQSLSALLEDLSDRGLLDETLVVWLGEFGRTPRMGVTFSNNTNNVGGRDHWCNCYSVALAGGGVRGGQVIGASDGIGAYPRERPVHISDLAATLFQTLGVDPRSQYYDLQGQLRFICEGSAVEEVWG